MASTQFESYVNFLPKVMTRQKSILEALEEKPMTARELAHKLGFTDLNAVKPRITELLRKDKIRVCGVQKDPVTQVTVRVYERVEG